MPVLKSDRLILRGFVATDALDVQRLAGVFEIADTTLNIPHPYADGLAELGYWIGLPFWGKGICTEAGKLVQEYAFETLGLKRLHARHLARNPSSGRVLEKLGFIHECSQKGHVKKWNKLEDVENYGLVSPAALGDGKLDHLVALNVIQAEECDETGKAFPHVIARLFEDGAMTLLSILGWTHADLSENDPHIVSLAIVNRLPCVANHSVAAYCGINRSQEQRLELEMRVLDWQTNEILATAKLHLSIKINMAKASLMYGQLTGRSTAHLGNEVLLMRRFTARHRGQAGHVNIQHFAQSAHDACRGVASLLGVAPEEKLLTSVHP